MLQLATALKTVAMSMRHKLQTSKKFVVLVAMMEHWKIFSQENVKLQELLLIFLIGNTKEKNDSHKFTKK